MPKTLTSDGLTFPAQTSPVGSESRTGNSIETPLQNASDRSAFVKLRLDNIDPTGEGARRVRRVTSIAALQAVTDLTDLGVILVDGVGFYQFSAASTATALSPMVVTPTSVGGGPGRWLWEALGSVDIANGIPKLDGNARLATNKLAASNGGSKILPANVSNGLIGIYTTSAAGPATTTSTSYVDVGGSSFAFTLEIGDIVLIGGQAYAYQADLTPAVQYTKWVVTTPTPATVTLGASELFIKGSALNEYTPMSVGTYFTCSVAGSHTFKLQQRSEAGSGGATVGIANLNIFAQHIRP